MFTQLRNRLNHAEWNAPQIAAMLAGFALVIGVIGLFLDAAVDVFTLIAVELAGIAVLVFILDELTRRRIDQQEKRNLIAQMRSKHLDVSERAAQELNNRGWLTDGSLKGVYLGRTNLQGAHLVDADLEAADLRDANLQGAYLTNANLEAVKLTAANLQSADLSNANLRAAYMFTANLREAYLRGAKLMTADLWKANLEGAYLQKADLTGADLSRSQLQTADLTGATLRGAHLEEVSFGQANLTQANLQAANLTNANLQEANLTGATFDAQTILPDGSHWTPEVDWLRFTNPRHLQFWQPQLDKGGNYPWWHIPPSTTERI